MWGKGGTFGRVRLVRQKQTGKFFAAKILKKMEILKSKQIDHVQNESQILNLLHHPFVVTTGTLRYSSRASRRTPVTSTSSWNSWQAENC